MRQPSRLSACFNNPGQIISCHLAYKGSILALLLFSLIVGKYYGEAGWLVLGP